LKKLLGLAGKKQSGKGSTCTFLKKNAAKLWHEGAIVEIFPMAGPLKKLCIDVLGLTPEQVYGTDAQKNSLTRYKWEDLPHYPEIVRSVLAKNEKTYGVIYFPSDAPKPPKGLMTAREVLQEIGTGIFRRMYENVWAEANIRAIMNSKADVALIDDVRFPNEVAAIQDMGGLVFRLTRDIYKNTDQHPSETSLDPGIFPQGRFDALIENGNQSVREQNQSVLHYLMIEGLVEEGKVDWDDLDYTL
jgi:hypothetical protein